MRPALLAVELHRDARGNLISLQSGSNLPFSLQRVFFIFDVPAGQSRGGHVTSCQELVIALRGSCRLAARHEGVEQHFHLTSPAQALYVPAGAWLDLDDFSPDALLAVAADGHYQPRARAMKS